MSVLFINGSPNKKGNTARLASELLDGRAYETLDLVDYKLYSYGQKFDDDQFDEIVSRMRAADIIVGRARRFTGIICAAPSAICWIVSMDPSGPASYREENLFSSFRERLRSLGC